jgi:general secretion pathway protein D
MLRVFSSKALRLASVVTLFLAAPSVFVESASAQPQPPPPPGGGGPTPAERPPGDSPLPQQNLDIQGQVQAAPYRPKPLGTRVKFNLQDADLGELVNHISGMTGKRFIYGPKVRQIKATVVSPEPVTLAEAYEAFLSILEQNGMTVVPQGQFLKIVDSAGVQTAATPIFARGAPVPNTDRFITRLYRLKNTGADEVAALLTKFKSKDGDISTYPAGQLLIITDTGAQVQRMIRIVEELDVGGAGSKMWIEPVHHGSAQEMAQRINELFDLGKGEGGGGGLTKVVPDEQTNSLVVVGTEESYLKLLELMKRLDGASTKGGKVHVLPLQNAVAEELANTLNQMLQGAAQRGGGPGQPQSGIFEGEVRVTADKATNSLVVTSSGRDYAALRLVIDELDQARRQVFIEAVILDLDVDNDTSVGMNYHLGTTAPVGAGSEVGNRDSLIFGGLNPLNSIGAPSDLQGLALGIRGPSIEGSSELLPGIGIDIPAFGLVMNAIAVSSKTNVVATPHILATDNTAAEINIGENVALQQSMQGLPNLGAAAGANGAAGGLGALGLLGGLGFNTPRQDVGTKIKITPHVNESNQIRLEIEMEDSKAKPAAVAQSSMMDISKRNVSTTLVVDNQQTVVIGGLMKDYLTRSRKKIPLLGDIPVLGFLFRSSQRKMMKSNLLLILTPHVIQGQADLRRIFERKMQERQEFLDRYFVFDGPEWKQSRDLTRANGLVENVRQAYMEVAERQRLEDESAPAEQAEHEPSDAIELPMEVRPGPATPRGANPGMPNAAPVQQQGNVEPAAPQQPRPRRRPRRQTNPADANPGANPPPTGPTGLLDSPFGPTRMARNVTALELTERTE